MKTTFAGLSVLASLAISVVANAADVDAAKRGEKLYMQHQCYSCHGTNGQGGERNAGPQIFPNPTPFVAFELQLRTPRNLMPRYSVQNINDVQLKDLYAYVENMQVSPAVAKIPLLSNAMR
ncbi:MAG: cytochrome c [Betaproteobacteria bacterium]|jgi:mono/diheme cytochrome c family protein|nr:cytochrome c [Betaproteobacteria bacterium]